VFERYIHNNNAELSNAAQTKSQGGGISASASSQSAIERAVEKRENTEVQLDMLREIAGVRTPRKRGRRV